MTVVTKLKKIVALTRIFNIGIMRRQYVRKKLAKKYLLGNGLEIGALHLPLEVPKTASVKYVDRKSVEDLRKIYPELNSYELSPVDIIDDGEKLVTIPLASQDFIIANHFIEHCEDPIGTILNHLSRLKSGGILYLGVPDKNKTFDKNRKLTDLSHIIRDFEKGPEVSRLEHYREWSKYVSVVSPEYIENHARLTMQSGYSIHYHVWRQAEFYDLLEYIRTHMKPEFTIQETAQCANEFIFILRKT